MSYTEYPTLYRASFLKSRTSCNPLMLGDQSLTIRPSFFLRRRFTEDAHSIFQNGIVQQWFLFNKSVILLLYLEIVLWLFLLLRLSCKPLQETGPLPFVKVCCSRFNTFFHYNPIRKPGTLKRIQHARIKN